MTLAYVFWHTPRSDVETERYEAALTAFLEAIRSDPPKGLIGCASYRIAGAPWIAGERAYEDWYLLADHTALGMIGPGAVVGTPAVPHRDVAGLSDEGSAGLYAAIGGAAGSDGASASWLDKPRGLPYPEFKPRLAAALAEGGSLWQRDLVLGPAPEFCMLGPEPTGLPGHDTLALARAPVG